jgi:hypothetical protein
MTQPLLTDAHVRRLQTWEAAQLETDQTAITPRPPARISPRWADGPPQPAVDVYAPLPYHRPLDYVAIVTLLAILGIAGIASVAIVATAALALLALLAGG